MKCRWVEWCAWYFCLSHTGMKNTNTTNSTNVTNYKYLFMFCTQKVAQEDHHCQRQSFILQLDISRSIPTVIGGTATVQRWMVANMDASWSLKVSIAAQKFATSTLISAPLKVVTIECIEHDVTCLNERVFIKPMNHLLANCSQSTLLAMVCRLSLWVLNTS